MLLLFIGCFPCWRLSNPIWNRFTNIVGCRSTTFPGISHETWWILDCGRVITPKYLGKLQSGKKNPGNVKDKWWLKCWSPFFHTILCQSNHWLDTNFKSSWWSHPTHTNQTTGSSEQKLSNSNHCVFFKLGPWEYQPFVCFVVSCVNLLILTLSIPKCYFQYECENYNTFMTWFYCNTQQSISNYSTMLFLNKIIRINKSSSCSQRQNS